MSLLYRLFRRCGPAARPTLPAHIMQRALSVFGLVLLAPATAFAGGVYVAGQDKPVAQAFAEALADNPQKSDKPFWVVVAGRDVALLTKTRSNADMLKKLKTAKDRGAEVYVCRSDLVRAGIRDDDLLDGVVPMYGYAPQDWSGLLPARKDGIALPADMKQSQLILKTCAGEPKAGN